ncbi:MAG: sulfite exporter TauE/SafE family protein [Bacteroidota bacterium]
MWAAWLGAIAIGLVLGLLGSGGSILTVPVLVYLAGEPDKVAIAESLAIVGAIALVGALPYARQRLVDWHSVLYFGTPAVLGTYGGAALSAYVPGPVQLTLFAVVMMAAAVLMFRGRQALEERTGDQTRQALWKIGGEGLVVGMLTGLVGVGGGFLIVPALVLLGGLPMRLAVGTSLLIIAVKSAAGFVKYLDVLGAAGLSVDWTLIVTFAGIGIGGSFVGNALSHRVPQGQLKRVFAVFLVIMGTVILVREGGALF